jgi:four helix bundle protein
MDAKALRDRSQKFAIDVSRFCDTLPKDPRSQEIAKQLHDAAHSAAMNYRAVCRARSDEEFIAKICITVEEADEAEGWIETLLQSGKVSGEEAERLLDEATQLLKIFAASKRTVLRNAQRRKRERLEMQKLSGDPSRR